MAQKTVAKLESTLLEHVETLVEQTSVFSLQNPLMWTPNSFVNREVKTNINIVKCTTLDAFALVENPAESRLAVLNSANTKRPGGRFLHGSKTTEAQLCYATTLYASQNSKNASAFYEESTSTSVPGLSTSSILYSPNVVQIRDRRFKLLKNKSIRQRSQFAVISASPINAKKMRRRTTLRDITQTMLDRVDRMLKVAALNNHRTLILNAWGVDRGIPCETIARIFKYLILHKQKYLNCFNQVIFAIPDEHHWETFRRVFYVDNEEHFQLFQKLFGCTEVGQSSPVMLTRTKKYTNSSVLRSYSTISVM